MKLSEVLKERGYVYQHSSETLEEITDGEPRTLYLGVDPTADSMHAGQLQGVLILRRFLDAGHRVVIIVGGGTGMIGDPGGKSQERNLLDDDTVARNTEALRAQFTQLFGGASFDIVNNAEWLHQITLLAFLRDVGKHFTVNEMIKRDSVRPRLETPDQSISYTEFSYMLLQAYDFLELNKRYDCSLQVGGSDQWGNMVSGIELIRKITGRSAYALSWPLLVDAGTGKKFGKSEGNAVWLDASKTSPYQFYQFWFNVSDAAVEDLLLRMTLLPKESITGLMRAHREKPQDRAAQEQLAFSVTELVHGMSLAESAREVSRILFSGGSLERLSEQARELLSREAPSATIPLGMTIVDALVATRLASSKREARQFIEDGAVHIGNDRVHADHALEERHFVHEVAILKRGKRNIALLVLESA